MNSSIQLDHTTATALKWVCKGAEKNGTGSYVFFSHKGDEKTVKFYNNKVSHCRYLEMSVLEPFSDVNAIYAIEAKSLLSIVERAIKKKDEDYVPAVIHVENNDITVSNGALSITSMDNYENVIYSSGNIKKETIGGCETEDFLSSLQRALTFGKDNNINLSFDNDVMVVTSNDITDKQFYSQETILMKNVNSDFSSNSDSALSINFNTNDLAWVKGIEATVANFDNMVIERLHGGVSISFLNSDNTTIGANKISIIIPAIKSKTFWEYDGKAKEDIISESSQMPQKDFLAALQPFKNIADRGSTIDMKMDKLTNSLSLFLNNDSGKVKISTRVELIEKNISAKLEFDELIRAINMFKGENILIHANNESLKIQFNYNVIDIDTDNGYENIEDDDDSNYSDFYVYIPIKK